MNFQQFAFNLSIRPSMFITGQVNYYSLCNLVQGYILALPNIDIQKFLQNKHEKHFSTHWSFFILNELAANNEIEAQAILFALLEEMAANPLV